MGDGCCGCSRRVRVLCHGRRRSATRRQTDFYDVQVAGHLAGSARAVVGNDEQVERGSNETLAHEPGVALRIANPRRGHSREGHCTGRYVIVAPTRAGGKRATERRGGTRPGGIVSVWRGGRGSHASFCRTGNAGRTVCRSGLWPCGCRPGGSLEAAARPGGLLEPTWWGPADSPRVMEAGRDGPAAFPADSRGEPCPGPPKGGGVWSASRASGGHASLEDPDPPVAPTGRI